MAIEVFNIEELLDDIFFQLKDDREALKVASLVSRQWHHLVARYLFSKLVFHMDFLYEASPFDTIVTRILANPDVCTWLTHLELSTRAMGRISNRGQLFIPSIRIKPLSELLSRLPNLRVLALGVPAFSLEYGDDPLVTTKGHRPRLERLELWVGNPTHIALILSLFDGVQVLKCSPTTLDEFQPLRFPLIPQETQNNAPPVERVHLSLAPDCWLPHLDFDQDCWNNCLDIVRHLRQSLQQVHIEFEFPEFSISDSGTEYFLASLLELDWEAMGMAVCASSVAKRLEITFGESGSWLPEGALQTVREDVANIVSEDVGRVIYVERK